MQRLWIGQAAHSCARSSNAVERVQDKTLGNLTMVLAPLFTSGVSLASCFPAQSLCFLIQREAEADHFCSSSPVVHDLSYLFLVGNTSAVNLGERQIFPSHLFLMCPLPDMEESKVFKITHPCAPPGDQKPGLTLWVSLKQVSNGF